MTMPALFEFETLPVRVLSGDDGELWFVASDVSGALEYRDAGNMIRILDEDEKGTRIVSTLGGAQDMLIINEAGLYSAILRSRKPAAKRFKRWVTHEVLPSIRKTGGYQTGNKPNVTQQIALSRHRLALLKELHRARDKSLRGAIHDQLAHTSSQLGLSTPALDSLGWAEEEVPDVLAEFWEALDYLDSQGVAYDHALKPNLLAVNPVHLARLLREQGHPLRFTSELRQAIRNSRSPRFLRYTTVASAMEGKGMKCWLFEKPAAS